MATKAKKAVESVMVSFDLFDLPTAQHKAGLAGLVLQIRYMEQAKPPIPIERIPVIETLTATGCRVRFTAASTQGLFDEVYGATPEFDFCPFSRRNIPRIWANPVVFDFLNTPFPPWVLQKSLP